MPIDFAELPTTADVYVEIGRRYVAEVLFQESLEGAIAGTLDFATPAKGPKKPNCNSAKSHFCQTANGRGSCVSLSKKCRFSPGGTAKQAADYIGQKAGGGKASPSGIGEYTVQKIGVRALRKDLDAHDEFYEGLLGDALNSGNLSNQSLSRLETNNMVRDWLRDEADSSSRGEFISIRDSDGNAQALVSIERINANDGVKVGNLITAPWNVAGDDPRQVKGAGTSAIAAMAQRSVAAGHEGKVTLDAIDSAIPFYEKLGFRTTGTKGAATTMELSPAAAQQLLSNFQNQ